MKITLGVKGEVVPLELCADLDEGDCQMLVLQLKDLFRQILYQRPVSDMPLSLRAKNVLYRNHIHTCGELMRWLRDGRTIPGAGRKCLSELQAEASLAMGGK